MDRKRQLLAVMLIFPRHVLAYMTEEGGPWGAPENPDPNRWRPMVRDINKLATSHDEVTLLFADIQGFTPMCKVLEPRVVMAFLNDLFTRFDRRLDEFGVYKVETIGDCYMVAGGLVHEDEDGMVAVRNGAGHKDRLHAERVFMFAKAMLSAASRMSLPTTGGPVKMRIGIHSGPVVSGVVGQRMPRFCLFGDTVNTASRMESTGVPGCIHASEAARALLRNEAWVATGGIEVKGRGLMQTYVWSPPDAGMVKTEAAGGMPSLEWKATTSSIGNPHGCWDKRWSQRQSQRHSQRLRNLQAQARTAGLTNSQLSRSCSAMQHSHTQVQAQSQSHIGKASRLHGDSTYYVDANGSSTLGGGAATAASATAAPAFISTHADPSKAMCAQPLALLSSALLPSPGWGGAGAAAAGASGSNSAEDGDSDSVSSSSGDSCVALAALLLESGIPEGPLRAPVVPPTGRLAAA
ncbi:hypothetical protein Vafri_8897 [Volvox africanus]|uniref:Guanylate cyclase domain-containing protein n=1 Tax=Volvox africanus TaxID=51714 RepID=A0A8J4B7K5_9CHLO|nr:hypothetical protein Vafri_8897 [Volvox africanus]